MSPLSSSSSGPGAHVLARVTCNDFRWFKGAIKLRGKREKRSIEENADTRKDKRKGEKLDEDKRVREIFRVTVRLFIIMKTKFQLNCSSLLCKQNSS